MVETKYYLGVFERQKKGGITRDIHYINAGNGLCTIIVKEGADIKPYFVYSDHLGSILAVTHTAGSIIAQQNFDAWGRNRNPANWTYMAVPAVPDWLYRGYTGHEHLAEFALINMNGRMYDPATGRMISPDNYVPMPWNTQGYNRYGYANNNPTLYVDKNGEWFGLDDLIVAGIGFITGYVSHGISTGNWGWSAVKSGGITAAASWLGYNTAGVATAFLSKTAGLSTGISTALGQGIGGAVASGFGSASSQIIYNGSINWSEVGRSALYGFGNGVGTGLFDQSRLFTKHFAFNHTAKYLLRSMVGEVAGGLAIGGDFSSFDFGLNAGVALPFLSDFGAIVSPRLLS